MPAIITLTVTQFTENTSALPSNSPAENCAIDLNFDLNGPSGPATGNWQKRDAEGEVFLCQGDDLGTIAVRRKDGKTGPVRLTFAIASAANVPALSPLSLVLRQNDFRDDPAKPKTDPDGSRNFRNQVAANDRLTVENHWVDKGNSKDPDKNKRQAPHWKFWIKVRADDGRLGWIDPIIENSDDMSA
jgi:hypothetical protein